MGLKVEERRKWRPIGSMSIKLEKMRLVWMRCAWLMPVRRLATGAERGSARRGQREREMTNTKPAGQFTRGGRRGDVPKLRERIDTR